MTATKLVVPVDKDTAEIWQEQGKAGVLKQRSSTQYAYWDADQIPRAIEAVNKGAALLDEQEPNWQVKVTPDKLDMGAGNFCIIGQVYGCYPDNVGVPFGYDVLADSYRGSNLDKVAQEHGFLCTYNVPYVLLDRVWVYLLSARQAMRQPVLLRYI